MKEERLRERMIDLNVSIDGINKDITKLEKERKRYTERLATLLKVEKCDHTLKLAQIIFEFPPRDKPVFINFNSERFVACPICGVEITKDLRPKHPDEEEEDKVVV